MNKTTAISKEWDGTTYDAIANPMAKWGERILSTATFHWILDHDTLFANLAAVLRPGGQLVAQCGGIGNLDSVRRAVERAGGSWEGHHYFASMSDEEKAKFIERVATGLSDGLLDYVRLNIIARKDLQGPRDR